MKEGIVNNPKIIKSMAEVMAYLESILAEKKAKESEDTSRHEALQQT